VGGSYLSPPCCISVPILNSAATINMAGGYFPIQSKSMEQSILSHPAMTLAYRRDDDSTDGSASDEDSMPGLVNDSEDEYDNEEADMIYHHPIPLTMPSSIANFNTTNNVINSYTKVNINVDMVFEDEAMCKFMNELRVAETDMSEPEYIEECPLCGLSRYPDDHKHIDICHLHVFCTVCQRYEGAYFRIDRCDGLSQLWMNI
jgi:hypothetical protein